MRKNINEKHTFIHPEDPTINACSHILWTGAVLDKTSTARNAVFYGDKAIDRSPCGTGTSARMAQWYAKGKLKRGMSLFMKVLLAVSLLEGLKKKLQMGRRQACDHTIY